MSSTFTHLLYWSRDPLQWSFSIELEVKTRLAGTLDDVQERHPCSAWATNLESFSKYL